MDQKMIAFFQLIQIGKKRRTRKSTVCGDNGVCTFTACGLLAAIVGLSMLLVPSPNEIVDLRAKVAALEARGGKIELTVCGPSKRLCAKIDDRSNNERKGWGQKGEYMILQGY